MIRRTNVYVTTHVHLAKVIEFHRISFSRFHLDSSAFLCHVHCGLWTKMQCAVNVIWCVSTLHWYNNEYTGVGRARAPTAPYTPACSPVDDSPSPRLGANDLTVHSPLVNIINGNFVQCIQYQRVHYRFTLLLDISYDYHTSSIVAIATRISLGRTGDSFLSLSQMLQSLNFNSSIRITYNGWGTWLSRRIIYFKK